MKKFLCMMGLLYNVHMLSVYEYKPMNKQSRQYTALSFICILCMPVSWKHVVTVPVRNAVNEIEWDASNRLVCALSNNGKKVNEYAQYNNVVNKDSLSNRYQQPSSKQHNETQKYECEESQQKWNGNLRRK